MRYVLQQLVMATLALYIASTLFPGLVISGGFQGLLVASVLLVLGFIVIRPILTIVTLPLGFLTLGLFSIVITAVILFLVSVFDKGFLITPFTFPGIRIFILRVPSFHANILLSYVCISVTIQVLYRLFGYIFDL